MIDVKELRIDNWIYMRGEPVQVYSIDRGGMSMYRLNDIPINKQTGCAIQGGDIVYDPIPLSPEILERLGFVKSGNAFTKGVLEGYMEIYVLDDVSVFMGDVLIPLPHVKYLHQLQNFYYSVMGQELTLSAPVA